MTNRSPSPAIFFRGARLGRYLRSKKVLRDHAPGVADALLPLLRGHAPARAWLRAALQHPAQPWLDQCVPAGGPAALGQIGAEAAD